MSKPNPTDRKYSKDHEWVLENGDGTVTMGITDHAQEMLTDIVYVELPPLGKKVKQFDPLAVVESVKSVSDVYAPVGGEVIASNGDLEQKPELINEDAFGKGWIAKLRMDNPGDLNNLIDAEAYEALAKAESH
jgi:glycine cleavage system H protein